MFRNKLPNQQLTAWLMAAILPAAIQLTAGTSWLAVLLAASVCLLCVCFVWHWGAEPAGRLSALLQWALLVAVLVCLSRKAPQSWPQGGPKAVCLILLGLAVWSAWKGPFACARVGSVLFWFVLLLYLILLGAGIKEIRIGWLVPKMGTVDSLSCVLLLTPAASIHLSSGKTGKSRLLLTVAFCTVAAIVTAGVLSPAVAAEKENPFYEMTRSLNLLGQARRFEAVLSAGMTAGWFSLMGLYMTLCAHWSEAFHPGWGKKGMAAAAALTGLSLLQGWSIPDFPLLILAAVFWVLVPLFARGIAKNKKSK